ncbi:sirohydrochlorin ferrochelatase [Sporolactobacillus inulinus]|uniref:Sirohydrochlorin ferrochelatase n=1 Tax=Sporolactobacillus inulinus TaxID=2078 RepID=A0A4Y1ZCV0_9BACL|nr:hypothetical protein [Sporolactobacillus inulinus]GAY76895.1 sirohydrochlorin ferrochelatase [Sporolactobacillus inulinus]
MLAVLYVSHGTRIHEGVKQANQFLSSCMKQVDAPIQRVCYLEIVQPGIWTASANASQPAQKWSWFSRSCY